jgi:hypothetical protein
MGLRHRPTRICEVLFFFSVPTKPCPPFIPRNQSCTLTQALRFVGPCALVIIHKRKHLRHRPTRICEVLFFLLLTKLTNLLTISISSSTPTCMPSLARPNALAIMYLEGHLRHRPTRICEVLFFFGFDKTYNSFDGFNVIIDTDMCAKPRWS